MVCRYCESRNAPGASVCAHCGAILRGPAAEKSRHKQHPRSQSSAAFFLVTTTLTILGAVMGGAAAQRMIVHARVWEGIVVGGLLGALIGALLGGGKTFLLFHLYRARHAALQRQVNGALTAAEERYTKELKNPSPEPQTRLNLAAWHLLKDDTEKAMQVLQTAQTLGVAGAEFDNNAGAALAMRGSLTQALAYFQRASSYPDISAQPFANEACVLMQTLEDPQAAGNALTAVRQALMKESKKARYYSLLGAIFVRDERLDEAAKQFQQALTLTASEREAQADCHVNLGVLHYLQGNRDEAERSFSSALALNPGNACALSNIALVQFLNHDQKDGLEKLRHAHYIDPRLGGAQASLGYALCRFHLINEGILACREALTLNPHLFEPHANLGKAYADSGFPDLAEHHLKRALQLQPQSWEAMQTLGVVEITLNHAQSAFQSFGKALALKPQHVPLLTGHAISCALLGQDTDAVRRIEQAQRLEKDNPTLQGHRAWLYLRAESSTLAAAEIELALTKLPKNAILHNNYGLAQVGLGAYEIALESFLTALQLDPDLHQVHYHIGCVYILLKKQEEAIKAWETASKYELNNPDCFANLGSALYLQGKYDEAVTQFRRVLQMRQGRMEDHSNLGLAYAKQGVTLINKANSVSRATQLIVKNTVDDRIKQGHEKHRQAIAEFDAALTMDPSNVILHSNRGTACYFANRADAAMAEWGAVSKLDPLYARRRGSKQQTEFDDTQVTFSPIDIPQRAIMLPLLTSGYLPRLVWGYDVAEWEIILSDPALTTLSAQINELHALERVQRALSLRS